MASTYSAWFPANSDSLLLSSWVSQGKGGAFPSARYRLV